MNEKSTRNADLHYALQIIKKNLTLPCKLTSIEGHMATINVRIDDDLKEKTDSILKDIGSSPTHAVTALYLYIAEHKKLPFSVTTSVKTPSDNTADIVDQMRNLRSFCWNINSSDTSEVNSISLLSDIALKCVRLNELLHRGGNTLSHEHAFMAIDTVNALFRSARDRLQKGTQMDHVLHDANEVIGKLELEYWS